MENCTIARGYWNGELSAAFTIFLIKVLETPEPPAHWQNSMVGTERQAVRITFEGQTWLIDNGTGTGYHKVTTGMGSPAVGHRSVGAYEIIKELPQSEWITEINQEQEAAELEAHDHWMQERYPVQYEKLLALRRGLESLRKDPAKHVREMMEVKERKAP